MTPYPFPDPAPLFWVHLFAVLCYAIAISCLYHAIRIGAFESREVRELGYPLQAQAVARVIWIAFFALFVVAFWAVESWAHFRTPFYVYDPGFPNLIPRIEFGSIFPRLAPDPHPCSDPVQWLMKKSGNPKYAMIPLAIPLLEASLTYIGLWIAMVMNAGYRLAPLIAALIMVDIDTLLDPVVAAAGACAGAEAPSTGNGFGRAGLGLWTWYVPNGPIEGFAGIADWFDVPLFNYAAWWSAPVILGAFVMAVQYLRSQLWPRVRRRTPRPHAVVGREAALAGGLGLLALGVFAVVFVVMAAPLNSPGPIWQWGLLIAALLFTVGCLIKRITRRQFTPRDPVDPALTRPIFALLLLTLAALFLEGVFLQRPGLIAVGVAAPLIAALLVSWPYPQQVRRFCQRLLDADRFLRIHYVGFAFMLVLLGAFSLSLQNRSPGDSSPDYALYLDNLQLGALLGIAICFHIWAFVLNDVIDLEIDRRQERRQRDPLVQGRIARATALVLALGCVPIAFLLAFAMGAPREAYWILCAAIALMAAYNWWGKRVYPLLTDFAQASAWACLALFAAKAVEPAIVAQVGAIADERWLLAWAVAVWGGGFILLINGIHGGLRDLANDRDCGCRTTAIQFGAQVDPDSGRSISNARIAAFAYTVHLAMFVLPTFVLLRDPAFADSRAAALIALYLPGSVSLLVLWRVVRREEPDRDYWIGYHLLVLLLPAALAFAPFLAADRVTVYLLLTAFFTPLLLLHEVVYPVLRVIHPEIAAEAIAPPSADTAHPSA